MATVWQDKACKIAHARWLCLTLWLALRLIEHMNIPARSKPASTTTVWAKHGKSNTTATTTTKRLVHTKSWSWFTNMQLTPFTLSSCARRRSLFTDLPWIWSWLNSIWKGQAVARWGKSDERVRTEKNLALNHDYWQASIAQGDRGNTGQSVISTERLWKQSKKGERNGKMSHNKEKKTHQKVVRPNSQTVQREIKRRESSSCYSALWKASPGKLPRHIKYF